MKIDLALPAQPLNDPSTDSLGLFSGANYFAQQFPIVQENGTENLGYIVIIPIEDNKKALFRFGGFGNGITTDTGHNGIDHGSGAVNFPELEFNYGHKYDLSVEVDKHDPRVLNGYVQNVTNPKNPGPKQFVGNLKFKDSIRLGTGQLGFTEQLSTPTAGSNQIHRIKGSFYDPYSESGGKKINGSLDLMSSRVAPGLTESQTHLIYGDSITGTVGRIKGPDGTEASTFDVAGAGWTPGTSIPNIAVTNDPQPWDPNVAYPEGRTVTHHGFIYRANKAVAASASSDPGNNPAFDRIAPIWTPPAAFSASS